MFLATMLFTALVCSMFFGSAALAIAEMRRENRDEGSQPIRFHWR